MHLGDIRAVSHRHRDETIDVGRRQIPHRRERIHPAGEEHFRLVDVADPGDGRLVQQCFCDLRVSARPDARRGLVGVEAFRQGVWPEIANLPLQFKRGRSCELRHRHVECDGWMSCASRTMRMLW